MNICLHNIASRESLLSQNLLDSSKLKVDEKLLYLYTFLENNGKNVYKYPNIISNIRRICGNCCTDSFTNKANKESDLLVTIIASCSDSVLAEGFVIY